jgi:hypothetical protein
LIKSVITHSLRRERERSGVEREYKVEDERMSERVRRGRRRRR